MRILHTSDWHLGQHFYGKTRLHEQSAFLDWLLQQVEQLEVDCLLVAGDLFDTGTPPSYARTLLNEFVLKLTATRCTLVLLAGNHDSVAVLNESQALFRRLGAYLVTGAEVSLTQHDTAKESQAALHEAVQDQPVHQTETDCGGALIQLHRRDGSAGAWLCAVPFLRARDLVYSQAGQTAADKQQSLQQAIADYYQQLFLQAQHANAALETPLPIVATGHLTTVGASTSDSVREIYIGSLEAFPASAFPPADYIALGHIHRSQSVAKSDHIRYSGSPFVLSFDECHQTKSMLVVDFVEGALSQVEPLVVPCFQPMFSLKGTLADIEQAITTTLTKWQNQPLNTRVWLEVVVNSEDYHSDTQTKLAAFCESLPVDILLTRRARSLQQPLLAAQQQEQLHELSVDEVFERRLQQLPELADAESTEAYQQRLRICFKHTLAQLQARDEMPVGQQGAKA